MLAFLSLIPGIGSVISTVVTKMFDAKVTITQARIGGDRDVAEKLVAAAAQAEHENTSRLAIYAGNKMLTLLLLGFSLPLVAFMWKVVIYDIVFQTWTGGSTDPIKGQVAEWATTIVGFLFGSATVTSLAGMWFNRKDKP